MDNKQKIHTHDNEENEDWIDDDAEVDTHDIPLYKIDSSPNDFNLLSYKQFIERGIFVIPTFQRCYVWDLQRASKLIESLIIGLPIPQIFLFENEEEKQLIIDGQQRLLSIFFFMEGRFPFNTKRIELRKEIINKKSIIDKDFLNNNTYCKDFKLDLPSNQQLHNKTYSELDPSLKDKFDLRALRSIFIKQIEPKEKQTSMYEIFHRLNTGGMNLRPQEIRNTMFTSEFYTLLEELNNNDTWRKIINRKAPDKFQRDKEIILRCIALASRPYNPSMTKFLNEFSDKTRKMHSEEITTIKEKFENLMKKITEINQEEKDDTKIKIFLNDSNKFISTVFDAIFVAYYKEDKTELSKEKIERIKKQIQENSKGRGTADKDIINGRITVAKKILYE